MSDRKDGGPVARPILMNGDLVRAVLDGRKTQTRRTVRGQLPNNRVEVKHGGKWVQMHVTDARLECPYGQPGDLLYVRETFARVPSTAYRMSDGVQQTEDPNSDGMCAIYRQGWERSTGGFVWTPSIHMPRWASRITLEIADVRVERLQDISEEDVDAECFGGDFPCSVLPDLFPGNPEKWAHLSMTECFARLWKSIYGAESWDANPWVWVVEFKPHMKNVDALLSEREGGGQ